MLEGGVQVLLDSKSDGFGKRESWSCFRYGSQNELYSVSVLPKLWSVCWINGAENPLGSQNPVVFLQRGRT